MLRKDVLLKRNRERKDKIASIKRTKESQEEKMSWLKQEMHSMKEHSKFLKQTVLPSLASMLNKEGHNEDIDELNLQFVRQLLLEVEYEFK